MLSLTLVSFSNSKLSNEIGMHRSLDFGRLCILQKFALLTVPLSPFPKYLIKPYNAIFLKTILYISLEIPIPFRYLPFKYKIGSISELCLSIFSFIFRLICTCNSHNYTPQCQPLIHHICPGNCCHWSCSNW